MVSKSSVPFALQGGGGGGEDLDGLFLGDTDSNKRNQKNLRSNLANTASLLWHAYHSLPSPSNHVNWVGMFVLYIPPPPIPPSLHSHIFNKTYTQGFYTLHNHPPGSSPYLLLGPFRGKPACQSIRPGHGVCGAAFSAALPLVVADTSRFPGHIACDAESRSEIVVPVVVKVHRQGGGDECEEERKDVVVAVLDVDCTLENGFDEVDEDGLGRLAALLARCCDWDDVINTGEKYRR